MKINLSISGTVDEALKVLRSLRQEVSDIVNTDRFRGNLDPDDLVVFFKILGSDGRSVGKELECGIDLHSKDKYTIHVSDRARLGHAKPLVFTDSSTAAKHIAKMISGS